MKIIRPVAVNQAGTFTRNSTGTYWDSNMTLQTAVANALRVTYDPSNPAKAPYALLEPATTNVLCASENFSVQTTDLYNITGKWNVGGFSAVNTDNNGMTKLVEDTGAANHRIYQIVGSTVGATYTFSVFAKAAERSQLVLDMSDTATGDVAAIFDLSTKTAVSLTSNGSWDSTSLKTTVTSLSNGMIRCTLTAKVGAGPSIAAIIGIASGGSQSYQGNGSNGIYVYGAQLEVGTVATSYVPTLPIFQSRASTGTYFDLNGVMQTAVSNVPRTTYDPSNLSLPPYLLIESAATNYCNYSQQLDNTTGSGWFLYQSTVVADSAIAPDGTATADKLVNNGAGEQSAKGSAFSFVAGTTYTGSVFAKAAGASSFQAFISSAVVGTGGLGATFDLVNGVVTSSSPTLASTIKYVGNGWYRCSWTFTVTTSGSVNSVWLNLNNAALDTTKSVYFWGAQLEAGSVATSYIKTTTAAATRAGDVVSYAQNRDADKVWATLPAATNLVTDSQGFTTGWVGSVGVSASAATFTDSSGQIPYKKLAKTTSASSEAKGISIGPIAAGKVLYATIAVRADTSNVALIGLYDGSTDGWGLNSNSTAKILGGPGAVSQYAGSGWFVTGLSSTADTVVLITRICPTASVGSGPALNIYPGNYTSTTIGDAILATRVQVEFDQATPYIPTTTTTVTRAATTASGAVLIYSNTPENDYPLWSSTAQYKTGDFIMDLASHKIYQSITGVAGTVSMTGTGGACTVTMTVAGATYVPAAGTQIIFGSSTTSTTAGTVYYVVSPSASSFNIATTAGGTAITMNNTYSNITATASSNINQPVPNTKYWLDCGTDNRWDMFDTSITSQTSNPSEIIVALVPGSQRIDSVVGMNCAASKASVSLTDLTTGSVTYSANVTLVSNSGVQNWYDYMYKPIVQLPEFVVSSIPLGISTNSIVLVRLSIPSGSAKCGGLVIGLGEDIGITEWGSKVGTIDYSLKTQDAFGNYQITPRVFSKKGDFTVQVPTTSVDYLQNLLAQFRATPIVYIGSNSSSNATQFNSTLIYGFYKDFEINIAYNGYSVCSLTLEGLT